MTREKELQQAIDNFSEAHKYDEDLDYLSMGIAFEEGVEWANAHPKNVWNSIDVEPKKGSWFLGQIGDNAYDTFIAEIEGKSMKDWLIGCNIKHWAYISDLLPKTK